MNGDTNSTSKPSGKNDISGSSVFLPIGIVFVILAVTMAITGNAVWFAFLPVGATFLILGLQGRGKKEQPPTRAKQD